MSEYEKMLGGIIGFVVVGLLFVLLMILGAYFEAQSYNKLTGSNVTTWEAIWVDLRIQSEPKDTK